MGFRGMAAAWQKNLFRMLDTPYEFTKREIVRQVICEETDNASWTQLYPL
jgi:hypothetical protein